MNHIPLQFPKLAFKMFSFKTSTVMIDFTMATLAKRQKLFHTHLASKSAPVQSVIRVLRAKLVSVDTSGMSHRLIHHKSVESVNVMVIVTIAMKMVILILKSVNGTTIWLRKQLVPLRSTMIRSTMKLTISTLPSTM